MGWPWPSAPPPGPESFLRCRIHQLPDHPPTLTRIQPGQCLDDLLVHLKLHLLGRVIGHRSQRILNPLGLPPLSPLLILNLSLLPSLLMPLFLQPSPALVLSVFLFLLAAPEEIRRLFNLAANTKLLQFELLTLQVLRIGNEFLRWRSQQTLGLWFIPSLGTSS